MDLRTRRSTGLFSGCTSSSSLPWRSMRASGDEQEGPEHEQHPLEALEQGDPAKMNAKRSTRAPKMPQNSTRNW